MSFTDTKDWLEKICGPADKATDATYAVPDAAASAKAFQDKLDYMNDDMRNAVDAVKADIKAALTDVSLKGSIDSGSALRRDKKVNVELLASLNKDGSVPIGVEQKEWDSYADAASTLEFIVIQGEKHEINSPEANAYLLDLGAKLAPLYKLSAEMAAKKIPNSKEYLFTASDIEKELWSPLVREGIIPSNLVPQAYSETVNVFRNGAAVYTELMAREDGTEMGGKKGIDKFLAGAKDVVSVGKVIGGEILRYDNLEIVEASREDIAGFIANKTKISVDSDALGDLGVVPEDFPEGTELSPLQVTRAKFDKEMMTGGTTDFSAWLAEQEAELSGPPIDGLSADEQAAQLDAIKNAQLTEAFGEYTRKKAMLTAASVIATQSIEAAQRARDRKRTKQDVGEAVAEGFIDAFSSIFTATDSATNLTQSDVSKDNEFKIKYACLATKAGIKGLNKLSQAAIPSLRAEDKDWKELVAGGLSDLIDGFGEAFTATGGITPATDDAPRSDTRFDQSQIGLIIKGVAIGVDEADDMYKAVKARDWAEVIKIAVAAGVTVPSTIWAGDIGDLTRRDVDLEDIEAGLGADGSGMAFGDPFIETRGAAGQTGFGMSGDMATLADQRSVLSEARGLLDQIGAESYADAKGDVKKKFERIANMTRKNPELASQAEVAAFLDPDPAKPPSADTIKAALDHIMGVLDATPIDDDTESAKQKDARIIAALDDVDDPQKLGEDVDELRDMLTPGDDGAVPDNDAILAKFKEVRDNLLTDEKVLDGIRAEMEEDEAWLEELKAEADLTRLDSYADPELRERERQKAINAIKTLTAELKKTEMKLNILDQATKGAVGIVLMAVPGASLLGKIRDLVADMAKLSRRATELRMWQKKMEDMRGNYSTYEFAVVGEKEVMAVGVTHDTATVAADMAGVAAEALRLADHTHITAAVLTTIEKITKALNEIWYRRWGEDRIKTGWKLFKQARLEPENRRLAREAIRENTTLGKCVLAYGACIDKDSLAQSAVQACGLTPETFEDSADVCQAVVDYLRASLHDSEVETIASYDADANWVPCKLELKLANWTMIKASAVTLDPPMSQDTFTTPYIDTPLAAVEELAKADPPDIDAWLDATRTLYSALNGYRAKREDGKLHAEMNIVAREFLAVVKRQQDDLLAQQMAAQGADA